MADQDRDKPENKGLKAAMMRCLGASDLARDAKNGALRGLRFGNKRQSFENYAVPISVVLLGTQIVVLGTMGGSQDLTPPHDAAVSQGQDGYAAVQMDAQGEREGNITVLTRGDDGAYQILQTNGDFGGTDQELYLVDKQIDAWRIAADIARQYQTMVQAMSGNVLNFPDQIPAIIRYEGLSPIFQSEGSERLYRIGDNKIEAQTGTFTLVEAQRAAEFWTGVSTQIAAGQYAAAPQSAPHGESVRTSAADALSAWAVMALGVGAGLGAIGGAVGAAGGIVVGGVARRRRDRPYKHD